MENEVKSLITKAEKASNADEALKFSQAACNAGNAMRVLEEIRRYPSDSMPEDQIKNMVSRFLGWRLPKPWNPDNGISYKRPNYAHDPADHDWPTGTNLFDASQAEAMIRYLVNGP